MIKTYFNIIQVFSTVVFFLATTFLSAQMYIQAGGQYSFYDHQNPLIISAVRPNFAGGLGVKIFANQRSKFEVAAEINSFRRNFYQKYPDIDFKYTFPGLEVRLLTNYAIAEKWSLEAGGMASIFFVTIKKNEEKLEVGEGFREDDYGVFVGGTYYLKKSLILGVRLDFWFYKMLEYQLIGNYGELLPKRSDIRTTTAAVFIRFQFLNRWK